MSACDVLRRISCEDSYPLNRRISSTEVNHEFSWLPKASAITAPNGRALDCLLVCKLFPFFFAMSSEEFTHASNVVNLENP